MNERLEIAAMMLQGMLANKRYDSYMPLELVITATELADCLLDHLETKEHV